MSMTANLRTMKRPRVVERAGGANWRDENPVEIPFPAVPLSGFIPAPPTVEELELVQRLFFLGDKTPRVVVFCGVETGDAAEMVCARTAEVLSGLVSETVCLVDANLRAPSLHLRYEVDPAFGFHGPEAETGSQPSGPMRGPSLWLLPAGTLKDSRPGFSPELMRSRLTTLRRTFGFLLICAPPMSTTAEGYLLGQMADGVVLSVMAQTTQRPMAQSVRRNLDLYNVRLLGAVLNVRPPNSKRAKLDQRG